MKNSQLKLYTNEMLQLYIDRHRKEIEQYHRYIKQASEELEEAIWLASQRLAKEISRGHSNSEVKKA